MLLMLLIFYLEFDIIILDCFQSIILFVFISKKYLDLIFKKPYNIGTNKLLVRNKNERRNFFNW